MKTGKYLRAVRDRKGYSQENTANLLHVSKQLVSHLENDRRNMTEDLAKQSVDAFNDAQYGFEIARQTAKHYVAPLATTGRAIEWHRLALEQVFINKTTEAIERIKAFSLVKPPEFIDDNDMVQVKQKAEELLDVQMVADSFLTCLEQEYGISIKECMGSRISTWKEKGWIG
ncbi:helix-turn-helix transcriptional regulator [Virgibacillus phasianinus]|uniref:helix-turn-helix transcriptional regulator n=1 Tax=Virgibacillus phasianinus TaxID=2017483 RepID=UPI0012FD4370|nr:helix-turn-helix transcriptional regulator [Virgibacillus phasianinus]